jgi:hypothetical protein
MKLRALALLIVACFVPSITNAGIIIDGTTNGLYNSGLGDIHAIDGPGGFLPGPNVSEGDPTIVLGADPGFAFTPEFGADWLGGDLTGGTWSAAPVAIPAGWALNTETAIIYEFDLASVSDLHIDLGVDNGIVVWLDGVFQFGATAPGGANLNEYDIDIAGLGAGVHSLQILRADHGGSQNYAISVDATPSVVGVPEPGTLGLLGLGLLGIGFARRKVS